MKRERYGIESQRARGGGESGVGRREHVQPLPPAAAEPLSRSGSRSRSDSPTPSHCDNRDCLIARDIVFVVACACQILAKFSSPGHTDTLYRKNEREISHCER